MRVLLGRERQVTNPMIRETVTGLYRLRSYQVSISVADRKVPGVANTARCELPPGIRNGRDKTSDRSRKYFSSPKPGVEIGSFRAATPI